MNPGLCFNFVLLHIWQPCGFSSFPPFLSPPPPPPFVRSLSFSSTPTQTETIGGGNHYFWQMSDGFFFVHLPLSQKKSPHNNILVVTSDAFFWERGGGGGGSRKKKKTPLFSLSPSARDLPNKNAGKQSWERVPQTQNVPRNGTVNSGYVLTVRFFFSSSQKTRCCL